MHLKTMFSDRVRLYAKALPVIARFAATLTIRRLQTIFHRWTYTSQPDAKAVVVLGGSFAGVQLAQRLLQTLPTGYRVVLVEKNSHLNYTFAFPRFSVIQGHEHTAFVPYDGIAKSAPQGIFTHVHDSAVAITDQDLVLASGDKIKYDFLAVATGSASPFPSKVVSRDRKGACGEFRSVQDRIKASHNIAIVGAGAVGVEIATDIKYYYPEKNVTLIQSRGRLLNGFGQRLHEHVLPVCESMGIRILLNERPRLPLSDEKEAHSLMFAEGHEEVFDFVVHSSPSPAFTHKALTSTDPLHRSAAKLRCLRVTPA